MNMNAVCHQCGRTVDASFIFCPWCGIVAEELVALALQMDTIFTGADGGNKQQIDTSRFARMEDTLGTLEQELSLLLSEVQPT